MPFVMILTLLILALVLYNARGWPKVREDPEGASSCVSVLIPARNEEHTLPVCLESLLLQGDAVCEVLVYDDSSTDRTPDIVRDFSVRLDRVRLLRPADLPEGWYGKTFACQQLAQKAQGDWLLFLDADTRLAPCAIGRMLHEVHEREITFLSCWPGIDMKTFWEKALMPMLNFVVFTLFPAPLSCKMKLPALGLAHGACLLIHREEYERMGGHRRVRSEIFEDTALARVWREEGMRGLCLDGQDVVRVRMYESFSSIWRGFQKLVYPAFQHALSFWLFLFFHATLFLFPFLWLAHQAGIRHLTYSSPVAVTSILLMRAVQAWQFRYPLWSIFFHPLATLALIAVGLSSWYRCMSGQGVSWKGRIYRGSQGEPNAGQK
jgi:chlorobactene glucosyltransferase